MQDTTRDTLIALCEASEGSLELNYRGIRRITTDHELLLTVHLMDGRDVRPEDVAEPLLLDAVYEWRSRHPALFQRILGAMM